MAVDIAALAVSIDRQAAQFRGLKQDLEKIETHGRRTAGSIDSFKRALVALGAAQVLRRIARQLNQAVSVTVDFGREMNNVRAITNASADQFDALSATAQQMGATTQFSAREAASAMTFLARTGLNVNETINAIPATLNLAAASATDLATSADIATNIMQGMGLQVSDLNRVVDVLAKTTNSANTDMQQLGDATKLVAPVAANAGMEIEETAALIGKLGDAGIQGTLAGTSLRNAILNLTTGAGAAGGAIERLGLTIRDEQGRFVGLTNVIEQLGQRAVTDADLLDLFGKRAIAAMQVLRRVGGRSLREFTGELQNAAGTAERMREQQLEGLPGVAVRLRSAFESLQITIGEGLTPILITFGERLTDTVIPAVRTLVNQLASGNKEQVAQAFRTMGDLAGTSMVLGFVEALQTLPDAQDLFADIVIESLPPGLREVSRLLTGVAQGIRDAIFPTEALAAVAERLRGRLEGLVEELRDLGGAGAGPGAAESIDEVTGEVDAAMSRLLASVTRRSEQIRAQAQTIAVPDALEFRLKDVTSGAGLSKKGIQALEDSQREILAAGERFEREVGFALAESVAGAFEQAFSEGNFAGLAKGFISSLLVGIGEVQIALGKQMIVIGTAIEAFKAAVAALGGVAAIAIGSALIISGTTLKAAGQGVAASGRGSERGGGVRSQQGGFFGDLSSRSTVNSSFAGTSAPPIKPVTFNVFGPRDPAAQRAIIQAFEAGRRRGL